MVLRDAGVQNVGPASTNSRAAASSPSPYSSATRRLECLPTPPSRHGSKRNGTTTTNPSSTLLRNMTKGRRRSNEGDTGAFSLSGERMMSPEEFDALPSSIQYVGSLSF